METRKVLCLISDDGVLRGTSTSGSLSIVSFWMSLDFLDSFVDFLCFFFWFFLYCFTELRFFTICSLFCDYLWSFSRIYIFISIYLWFSFNCFIWFFFFIFRFRFFIFLIFLLFFNQILTIKWFQNFFIFFRQKFTIFFFFILFFKFLKIC